MAAATNVVSNFPEFLKMLREIEVPIGRLLGLRWRLGLGFAEQGLGVPVASAGSAGRMPRSRVALVPILGSAFGLDRRFNL